jgi:hypothetical protein
MRGSNSESTTDVRRLLAQALRDCAHCLGRTFLVDLNADRNAGHISLIILGDSDHAAFDNVTFVDDRDTLLLAEDRGDTLHDQLNTLDSIWAYKLNREHP